MRISIVKKNKKKKKRKRPKQNTSKGKKSYRTFNKGVLLFFNLEIKNTWIINIKTVRKELEVEESSQEKKKEREKI